MVRPYPSSLSLPIYCCFVDLYYQRRGSTGLTRLQFKISWTWLTKLQFWIKIITFKTSEGLTRQLLFRQLQFKINWIWLTKPERIRKKPISVTRHLWVRHIKIRFAVGTNGESPNDKTVQIIKPTRGKPWCGGWSLWQWDTFNCKQQEMCFLFKLYFLCQYNFLLSLTGYIHIY